MHKAYTLSLETCAKKYCSIRVTEYKPTDGYIYAIKSCHICGTVVQHYVIYKYPALIPTLGTRK